MLVHRVPGTPSNEDVLCELVDRSLRARSSSQDIDAEGLSIGAGLGVPSHARGVVHRLDRGTSGLVILAKSDRAHAALVVNFFRRLCSKSYLCVTLGSPIGNGDGCPGTAGVVKIPLDGYPAESRWTLREELYLKECLTHEARADATIIEVETLTGRKHQVRRHMMEGVGCPIAFDPMYRFSTGSQVEAAMEKCLDTAVTDDKEARNSIKMSKGRKEKRKRKNKASHSASREPHFFFLHAESLKIPHPCPKSSTHRLEVSPFSKEESCDFLCFQAPIPAEWNMGLRAFRRKVVRPGSTTSELLF
jgi:23S rRNA-/tRNA-specific pseudouridylate synthase